MSGRPAFVFESGRTARQLAEEYGYSVQYVHSLRYDGLSEADIVSVLTHKTITDRCKDKGIRRNLVYQRMARGMTLDEAIEAPLMTDHERTEKLVKYRYHGKRVTEVLTNKQYNRFLSLNPTPETSEELVERILHEPR